MFKKLVLVVALGGFGLSGCVSHSIQPSIETMQMLGKSAKSGDLQALLQLRKYAAQGDPVAEVLLGDAYSDTHENFQDFGQAVSWYRKAADQGDAEGQFKLGISYATGLGVPSDWELAKSWYLKSAQQGNVDAEVHLASLFCLGFKVPRDDTQAAYWYRKAAEQGNTSAQLLLGSYYETGSGVPQDFTQAVFWYRKAAEKGDTTAQIALAGMYSDGRGVSQNNIANYILLSLAVHQRETKITQVVQARATNPMAAERSKTIQSLASLMKAMDIQVIKDRDQAGSKLSDYELKKAKNFISKWKQGDEFPF